MYTSREEDLLEVVTYRHSRIITVSRILNDINHHLKILYEWKEKHRKSSLSFTEVIFSFDNVSLVFNYSAFNITYDPKKDDDIRKDMSETLRNLNWSMLSSYITYLECEREGLITEFNSLETAKLPEDGKEVQN